MFSRTSLVLTLCAVLMSAVLPQPAARAVPMAITLVAKTAAPSSEGTKFPDVAAGGSQVFMVSTPGDYQKGGTSTIWQKVDSAKDIPAGTKLGDAGSQADYRSSTVAVGPDGTAYTAWTDAGAGRILIRRKVPDGNLTSVNTVVSGVGFPTNPSITVATDGAVFVAWNSDERARYKVSRDGGVTWTGTQTIGSLKPFGGTQSISLASGPNGRVVAAVGADGNIYAGIWNGSSFDVETVATGGLYSPSATVGGDGRIYVAWRQPGGGVFYSERQSNGSWPASRLANTDVYGTVGIGADQGGNVHIAWADAESNDIFYAYRANGGNWEGPERVEFNTLTVNTQVAGSLSSAAFGHIVHEDFRGNGIVLGYEVFSSVGGGLIDATPVIEGGAAFTNKAAVTVTFKDAAGNPTQARASWGAPPTDQNPWQNISNGAITVAAPTGAGTTTCTPLTLYTQVRNASNQVQQTPKTAAITFDRAVQANVVAFNPNIANLATIYTPIGTNDSSVEDGGASDGDPNYTRNRQFFLGITNTTDCSGLNEFSVEGSLAAAVPQDGFASAVPLPGDPTPGPKAVNITVSDKAGNVSTTQATLIYDPADTDPAFDVNNTAGLPVLTSSMSATVSASTSNSVLRTLTFANINVRDNLYDMDKDPNNGNSFWGVWIANSRSDDDPQNQNDGPRDPNLVWFPVEVSNPGATFSVPWSLFSGLNYGPARDKTGDYFVYVRFLDGAGNPSAEALKAKVTLQAGYTLPQMYMPFVYR